MTSHPPTNPRAEVYEHLRRAFESALGPAAEGVEARPRPPLWDALDAEGSCGAGELLVALTRLPSDWCAASLLASGARANCERAGWAELARLARCVELFPALKLARARRRDEDPAESYSRGSERLTAMLLEEIRENPGHDDVTKMLMVHRYLDEARARAAELIEREDWPRRHSRESLAASELLGERLEALRSAAVGAGLEALAREAGAAMLDVLAEAVEGALAVRDWRAASRLRGRYLLRWHEVNPERFPDRSPEDTHRLLYQSRKIGETVGAMHFKNIKHGNLLLENFSEEGAVKSFGQTVFLESPDYNAALEAGIEEVLKELPEGAQISPEHFDALSQLVINSKQYGRENPHVEDFVEDLGPLWNQLSPARREAFASGYAGTEGFEAASDVLARVEERVPARDIATHGGSLPFAPLRVPHFAVRAAGYALRHFATGDGSFATLPEEVEEAKEPETQLRGLFAAVVEKWRVDPQAHSESVERLLSEVWELIEERKGERASGLCEEAVRILGPFLEDEQRRLFVAYGLVARASAAAGDDEVALNLVAAASELVTLRDPEHTEYAFVLMSDALARARAPEALGEVAVKCMTNYVQMASERGGDSFLELALAVEAQLPPFGLSEEHADAVAAYAHYARALRPRTDDSARASLLSRALEICYRHPSLARLKDAVLLQGGRPEIKVDAPDDEGAEGSAPDEDDAEEFVLGEEDARLPISPETRRYLAQRNWPAAAGMLLGDLLELEAREPRSPACQALAAKFIHALQTGSDYVPHMRARMAEDLSKVVARYAPAILSARGRADSPHRMTMLASRANTFGWAAVALSPFLPESSPLLDQGVELLELAVELSPKEKVPQIFSFYANNLALSYQRAASRHDADSARPLLERAASLMKEVTEVDERLSQSTDPYDRQVAATAYLDHFNLGLILHDLAKRTYDATWISRKPQDSARSYRQAAEAFAASRAMAQEQGRHDNAGTAANNLALVFINLCEHFLLEKTWAGGDIQHAFYEWVRVVAGGHFSTEGFLEACAQSALACATEGARQGIASNPALMLESINSQLQLWSLFNRHPALAPSVARHSLVTLLELLDEMSDAGAFERYGEESRGLAGLQPLLEALFRVEFCQHITHHAEDARAAHAAFKELSRTGDAVARGVAQTRLQWLELQPGEGEMVVNGLYLGASDDGLELRIPSQRRRLRLAGLEVSEVGFNVRDSSRLRKSAAMLAARMESALNLEDLPPALLTGRVTGSLGGSPATIEATRLPIASWDSWALELKVERAGAAGIRPSLPFVGMYDAASGELVEGSPATLRRTGQSLIFSREGIILEVTLPLTTPTGDDPEEEYVTVGGSAGEPEIILHTRSVVLVVKTTPRVVSADVSYFVRRDRAEAALCCAASFDLATPSVSFPTPVLHAYAPLFFFDDELPPQALSTLRELNPHEVVVVGLPEEEEAALALLRDLFDPRRELFILVEERERERAAGALAGLRREIFSAVGGPYLMRASATQTVGESNEYYDPLTSVQAIVVPRGWTPTAAQMLLDLAAVRRLSVENVPVVRDGHVTFANIKGNPFETRLRSTIFTGIVNVEELAARYLQLSEQPLGQLIMKNPDAPERSMRLAAPTVPRRPVFILPEDPLAAATAVPYVRHLGALALPRDPAASPLLDALKPTDVYATGSDADGLTAEGRTVHVVPDGTHDLTRHYQTFVAEDYRKTIETLPRTHPHLIPSRQLLEEMQPADYVVLCLSDEAARHWAYLAANYAAAIHAPLLLSDIEINGDASGAVPSTDRLGGAYESLVGLSPTYVGFVSPEAALPIELIGAPPLSTRFALGRLSGPDLTSTSLLITRAALGEDVERPATISALMVDCSEALPRQYLDGARREVEAIHRMLSGEGEISARLVRSENTSEDKTEFLRLLPDSHLVHFAGHGHYDSERPDSSGLRFREGVMRPLELTSAAPGAPIIFSNACETGLVGAAAGGDGRAWSGLAAAFISQGAVNYLGSLRPIYDKGSALFALRFYKLLLAGHTVGEALLRARAAAYQSNDWSWDAYVLFGCPRNRLRARPGVA